MSEATLPKSSVAAAMPGGFRDPRAALVTSRLTLRAWEESDRAAFAALHADVNVMADLGGPIDRAASDTKFDAYVDSAVRDGCSRWAAFNTAGEFLGYVGVVARHDAAHPLGVHREIGWRLNRPAWGHGYATEAARAALADAFAYDQTEILAYTAADNHRSREVMARLGLIRDDSRDFVHPYGRTPWSGLVWVATAPLRVG